MADKRCEHGTLHGVVCPQCDPTPVLDPVASERRRCRAWAFRLLGRLPDGNEMLKAIDGGTWPEGEL